MLLIVACTDDRFEHFIFAWNMPSVFVCLCLCSPRMRPLFIGTWRLACVLLCCCCGCCFCSYRSFSFARSQSARSLFISLATTNGAPSMYGSICAPLSVPFLCAHAHTRMLRSIAFHSIDKLFGILFLFFLVAALCKRLYLHDDLLIFCYVGPIIALRLGWIKLRYWSDAWMKLSSATNI